MANVLPPTARTTDPGFYQAVIPILPAFMAYERGMVDWLGGISIPREGSHLRPKVMYAGGEKAVLAIKAITENRNDRAQNPVITIKLNDVQPNLERYHPPESTWGVVYNSENKATATRAARVAKPAAYKCSYEVGLYPVYEQDLRYMMFNMLQRFHRHGGQLSYLTMRDGNQRQFYPLWLRSFSNATSSATGENDREVRGTLTLELEAYLPLPFKYVPIFRHFLAQLITQGTPGVLVTKTD